MRGLQNQQRIKIHRTLVGLSANRASLNPVLIVDILSAEDRDVLRDVLSRVTNISNMDKAVEKVARVLGMANEG